jgi:WD40 repeat protein
MYGRPMTPPPAAQPEERAPGAEAFGPGDGIDHGARVVSPRIHAATAAFGAHVLAAVPLADARTAAVALGDGRVVFPGLGDGEPRPADLELGAMALSVQGDPGRGRVLIGTEDGRLLAVRPGAEPVVLADTDAGWIEALAVAPDGGRIAFAQGRTVQLLDAAGGETGLFRDHPSTVTGLAFSPSGGALAAAHYGGVSVYTLDDGERRQLRWHGSHIAVRWSPDGRFIATAMQDRELHCWPADASSNGVRMAGYPTKVRDLAFTPDGAFLTAAGADTVTAWDCRGKGPGGKPPLEVGYVFDGLVTRVAPRPGGAELAAGYDDGAVLIGGIESGHCTIARAGGGAPVSALAWTDDGTRLLAGTEDGSFAVLTPETAAV